jgi:hypothetical protein
VSKRPRGPLPDWKPRTARQKAILADVLTRYQEHQDAGTLPRGGRGIFYDLRPNGQGNGVTYRKPDSKNPVREFDLMEAHQEAVREVVVLARRAGMIRESWVADDRAPTPYVSSYDENADEEAESIARRIKHAQEWFSRDPQRGQPVYVESLVEAEDLAPRLHRISEPYGVHVYPSGGFDGLKGKREFAERAMEREVPTVVLDVGDRDRHGEMIYVAAAEDAVAWADGRGEVMPVDWLQDMEQLTDLRERYEGESALLFVRLALTTEQADDLNLLDADGKAEADAVPVPVMDRFLTEAIEALQDPACRDSLLEQERAERERLPEVIRAELNKLGESEEED